MSSAAEVSIAASQQLLALAAVAVGEGAWASTVGGFTVDKALRYAAPNVVVAVALVAASGSVGSGEASSMTPGLVVSTVATLGLVANYVIRLREKYPKADAGPEKETVALAAALAFFGFSTAFQAIFAAGIVQLPDVSGVFGTAPPIDVGVPESFPDMSQGMYPSLLDDASVSSPPTTPPSVDGL